MLVDDSVKSFMKKQVINEKYNISGFQIKKKRKEMKMSQEYLAEKMKCAGLNTTQKMISRIETGDRIVTDYELICFAEIFGISVDELIKAKSK